MTHLTRGRAQATRCARGARHNQQSFLPLVFLEWALPVLNTGLGPLLTRQRGFPQGHRTARFLAAVQRFTSKKSHTFLALTSQSPALQHPNTTPVPLQSPPYVPPQKSLASENWGPGIALTDKALGFEQMCTSWPRPEGPAPQHYKQSVGGTSSLTAWL